MNHFVDRHPTTSLPPRCAALSPYIDSLLLGALALLAAAWLLLPPALVAQPPNAQANAPNDRATQGPPARFLALGAGTLIQLQAYRDLDSTVEFQPIPLITYEDRRFFLTGLRTGVKLSTPRSPWDARVMLEWDFSGYDEDEGSFFAGMEERRSTLGAGLSLGYEWGERGRSQEIELSLLHDVLDRHGGYTTELKLEFPRRWGEWNLSPSVAVRHFSSDYVRYYFGVQASESTTDRPLYRPDASTDLGLGLQLRCPLQGKWFFFGLVQHTLLDDAVEDSPLVDSNSETTGLVGIAYRLF